MGIFELKQFLETGIADIALVFVFALYILKANFGLIGLGALMSAAGYFWPKKESQTKTTKPNEIGESEIKYGKFRLFFKGNSQALIIIVGVIIMILASGQSLQHMTSDKWDKIKEFAEHIGIGFYNALAGQLKNLFK